MIRTRRPTAGARRGGLGTVKRKSTTELYNAYIAARAPFAIWPLSEISGTNADDPTGAFDGTYTAGVTLNATTFPDGTPASLFDATGDVISIPFAGIDVPFDGAVGTISCWFKPRASSVWTDGVSRIMFSLGADANNRVYFNKSSTDNTMTIAYRAGGTAKLINQSSYSPNRWFHSAITWSKAADQVKCYLDGAQVGATLTGLGTWSGALFSSFTAIGNFAAGGGANFWDGYIKYPTAWNRVLTATEIEGLAPPSFLV